MEEDKELNVIEIERQFDVDVETLFKAWTEAEQLKQWWHPMGESLTDVKNDLNEGGEVAYYVGEAGLEITGTYKEVVLNEKLVYSWVWNMSDEGSESGYSLNVSFSAEGEGSKLRVIQEGFSGPEFLKPHQDGWDKGLDDLESYLSGNSKGIDAGESQNETQDETSGYEPPQRDNLKSAEGMSDRSGGYNEAPEQVKVGGG
ncbi:SRPBCC domain-containing protein [Dyadobacter sp. CY261]|uniref:SRPBCC family protein n=1 Tax=Dyadobacter sp. CY261 TaxID=2907203 RepID=UPI001F27337F|nr:SRPBCC domain-containing protein [Dyadobacter sp. CY261]MCF0074257.1 SRPBCC domain-containing protein [Dyadobacter sp. CY261]